MDDSWSPLQFDGLPLEEEVMEGDGSLEKELAIDNIIGEKIEIIAPVTSPSLDFNDNEDIPTELSDSSDTHDEGEPLNTCLGHPVTSPLCSLKGTGLALESESRFWISEHTPDQGQLGSQRKEVIQAKAVEPMSPATLPLVVAPTLATEISMLLGWHHSFLSSSVAASSSLLCRRGAGLL